MALAALIIAAGEAEGEADLAVLSLFAQTVLEQQVRVMRSAGAGHIVVLAHRLPAALIEAIDRLRDGGIEVQIARTARDAADHIHPDEALLLIDEGLVPSPALIEELTAGAGHCLLAVEANDPLARDRIDATHFWGGAGRIDGALLRQTAAMLGEWVLAPTLVRTAVQAGASLLPANPDAHPSARRLRQPGDEHSVARWLLAETHTGLPGFAQAGLTRAGQAMGDGLSWLDYLPVAFGVFAVALLPMGQIAIAALLLLLGAALGRALSLLARANGRHSPWLDLFVRALPWATGLVLVAAGLHDWRQGAGAAALILSLWAASLIPSVPAPLRSRHGVIALAIVATGSALGQLLIALGILVALALAMQFVRHRMNVQNRAM